MKSIVRATVGVVIIACLVMAVGARFTTATPPEVFADLAFKDAKQASIEQDKYLIVDATAVWCGPCKMMDESTWIDPTVASWIDEHAIAIQLDVDEEAVGARMLKIQAMPTIILFKEGKEFDRVVGYRDAEQLLEWLESARDGRRDIDRLREAAGDRMNEDGEVNIRARYDLAGTLLQRGDLEEATEEYLWLWDNMLTYEPAMVGVRSSFMAGEMQELAAQYEPARAAFTENRDALQADMDGGSSDYRTVADWLCLNGVVGDEDATLRWYERVKDDVRFRQNVDHVANELFELLTARERWTEAGKVLVDPVAHARAYLGMLIDEDYAELPEDQVAEIRTIMMKRVRERAGNFYAACLAAEREEEAAELADWFLGELDDAPSRIELVQWALRVDQPREIHRQWLSEAEAQEGSTERLGQRLDDALKEHERD